VHKPPAKAHKRAPQAVQNVVRSAAVAPTGGSSSRFPDSLALLLGIGIGLLLLLVAAASLPVRAMGHPAFQQLVTHREDLLVAAAALGFGILIGLVVVAAV
jgi:hypothetical protein